MARGRFYNRIYDPRTARSRLSEDEKVSNYAVSIVDWLCFRIDFIGTAFNSYINLLYYPGLIKRIKQVTKGRGIKCVTKLKDCDDLNDEYISFKFMYVIGNVKPTITITKYEFPEEEEDY